MTKKIRMISPKIAKDTYLIKFKFYRRDIFLASSLGSPLNNKAIFDKKC